MKIENIRKGQKLYQVRTTKHRRSPITTTTVKNVYVMEVDHPQNRVNASINGHPAQWFHTNIWKNWTDKNPQSTTTK